MSGAPTACRGLTVAGVGRIGCVSRSTYAYGVDGSICSHKSYSRETVLMSSIHGSQSFSTTNITDVGVIVAIMGRAFSKLLSLHTTLKLVNITDPTTLGS